ncbi:MAG TPA: hypothetical protein VGD29_14020 [Actinoplanes sp.]
MSWLLPVTFGLRYCLVSSIPEKSISGRWRSRVQRSTRCRRSLSRISSDRVIGPTGVVRLPRRGETSEVTAQLG